MEELAVAKIADSMMRTVVHRILTAWMPLLAVIAIAAACGCKKDVTEPAATASTAENSVSAADARPVQTRPNLEKPVVKIETSAGTITVELDGVLAPGTVRNFLNCVNEGFYDNTLVHYVDSGKLVLAGGYSVDEQSKAGRLPIRNEAHNGLKNVRGTVAMTRDVAQIDSATTQFFINLADAPGRDHTGDTAEKYGYCVFGKVTEGLDVADKISQSTTADHGGDLVKTPDPAVVIKSVRLVQ
jgi:cyclophilin family peptidyl-prolyl cis-trans isomerase